VGRCWPQVGVAARESAAVKRNIFVVGQVYERQPNPSHHHHHVESGIDQRSLMFSTGISKVLSLIFVRHITDTKNPCVLVLTRCHVIHINHVLTPCHVTEINYELR